MAVWMRTVPGSTISTSLMGRSLPAVRLSLFGTVGRRLRLPTTACASKSVPSWHFTPGRSLNSQVRSSTTRQLVASPGMLCARASCITRLSKMFW